MSVYDRQIFQNFSGVSSNGKILVTIFKLDGAVTIIGSVQDHPFVVCRATWTEAVQSGMSRTTSEYPEWTISINEAFADAIAKFKLDYTELTPAQREELGSINPIRKGSKYSGDADV